MNQPRLLLDYVLDHVSRHPDRIYLTQPIGGGKVVDLTWSQVVDEASRMAAHLRSMGIPPGARIAILSKNCAHFIVAELAIWMAGCTTVAIFPTETASTVRYVLEHSEATLLFVGKLDTWPQQKTRRAGVAALHRAAARTAHRTSRPGTRSSRAPSRSRRSPRRGPDELAMLLYTSGSTGQPKGVMVTFAAITRAAEGIAAEVRRRLGRDEDGRLFSYLPLAHAFERSWVEAASLVDGRARVYFAESLDTFVDDLRRARPTLFISVPRLWLKFQQGVFAKMPPQRLDRLLGIPIIGRIVGRKVLGGLGLSEVAMAGSGSAPIPPDLIQWYRRLGLRLYEGYAMTEDSAYSHTSNADFSEPGYVGVPLPGVEVRLADDGEILIRSPGQFSGYFKQPELTAASFTEDGFFRTGDLGERRADGMLRLTGRAKELFKTAKGKYVAPAPIENRINAHPMVELSLVSGVGQPAAYALVVLAEEIRKDLGEQSVRDEVERELEQLLRQVNAEVADYERLQMFVVVREPWSIENGCLTPTMKVKRARIESVVASQVEGWYASGKRVLWT